MLGIQPCAHCKLQSSSVCTLRLSWEQEEDRSCEVKFYCRKDPGGGEGLYFAFLEEEEPVRHTFGRVWGDGTRGGLDLCSLLSQLFAEEQAAGPSRLLCRDGFSTILHLLLGSPRPAAETLHAELCQAGPHQGLSLCESLSSRPTWTSRAPSALGREGTRAGGQSQGADPLRGEDGRDWLEG